jgi:hypothetical protein
MLTSVKTLIASVTLLFISHTAIAATVVGSTPAEFNMSGGNGLLGAGWSLQHKQRRSILTSSKIA